MPNVRVERVLRRYGGMSIIVVATCLRCGAAESRNLRERSGPELRVDGSNGSKAIRTGQRILDEGKSARPLYWRVSRGVGGRQGDGRGGGECACRVNRRFRRDGP